MWDLARTGLRLYLGEKCEGAGREEEEGAMVVDPAGNGAGVRDTLCSPPGRSLSWSFRHSPESPGSLLQGNPRLEGEVQRAESAQWTRGDTRDSWKTELSAWLLRTTLENPKECTSASLVHGRSYQSPRARQRLGMRAAHPQRGEIPAPPDTRTNKVRPTSGNTPRVPGSSYKITELSPTAELSHLPSSLP